MDVARFSSEDERRRFYGEDHHGPPPRREIEFGEGWTLTTDPGAVYTLRWVEETREIFVIRRPRMEDAAATADVPYNQDVVEGTPDDDEDWLDTATFARDYSITDGFPVTGRFAAPPGFPGTVPPGTPDRSATQRQPQLDASWPHPVQNMHFGTQVLGWAESRGAVEEALNGWEAQMPSENSLQWVRERLAEAAGDTPQAQDRRRASWSRRHPRGR